MRMPKVSCRHLERAEKLFESGFGVFELAQALENHEVEVARLKQEQKEVCQNLVGRDDCEDLPSLVLSREKQRERAMGYMNKLQNVLWEYQGD